MLTEFGRRVQNALRRLPDRLLHGWRHRAAFARQSATGHPNHVLILCYGNICRSPYAEARLRRMVEERGWRGIVVESAGFIGPGRTANDSAQRAAQARGIDLAGHRSRTVNHALAASASLLIVMSRAQARDAVREAGVPASRLELLGDLDPEEVLQRDIPDPYGESAEVFERVFDRIDRCLSDLVQAWGR